MDIVRIPIDRLTPDPNNAKDHPDWQIEQIVNSIEQFGNLDPIGVWGDQNIIVEGHGRYEALKELGYQEAECIRLDWLSEEERRAYALAHNKLTMNSGFIPEALSLNLDCIQEIDMGNFGFEKNAEVSEKLNERSRTDDLYNLDAFNKWSSDGFWEIPTIPKTDYVPKQAIGFNYLLSKKPEKDCAIHFFIDDYQFERIWARPDAYTEKLREWGCIFSPDFSLYLNMPRAMKLWNVYRSRFIGNVMAENGIKVIPTLQWAEPETFSFCFDGIEPGGVVAVSTIGAKKDPASKRIWFDGMNEAIKRIRPHTVVEYGGDIGFDYSCNVVRISNLVAERMKKWDQEEQKVEEVLAGASVK